MNGVVYSTRSLHSNGSRPQVIMEIWIESIGMCVNDAGEAFPSEAPRTAINHFGTFDIADPICHTIRDYVEKKKAYEKVSTKVFSALKRRLVNKKAQHNRIVK